MKQEQNNPINSIENNQNSNLKQQYNDLKKKIENLKKNNLEMLEMYKSEEQRLIKSNEFLMQKDNKDNSKNIKELEAEVLKMRNNIRQLQNLLEPRNGNNLIENDNLSNKNINNKLNNQSEEKIKEEYLLNYKNKLKTEFEKKLIMKHQELIDFYTKQNKKIIENNLDKENLIDIDEIKFFSIKNNTSKEPFSLSDEEDIDFNFDKINLVLSLNCLKEEFPKEFFIDYILDEAYTERGKTSKLKINKNESLRKPSAQNLVYENEEFKTNYNKIAEKICQLFDIKDKEDINMIKTYINEILKIDKNLRNYFEKNMNKYRFAPFEKFEQEKYDEKIKSCFEKHKEEIQNLSKLNDSIISYQAFDEFLNRCLNEEDKENEFIFYIMSLMKLSKNERKAEKNERLKALKLFEFNLKPFYEKIIKQ